MKKKKVDKRTILKKIGKIGLIVFNVLTGIWFFISIIAVIIASSTGAINTNSNNNSSHAVIFNENRPRLQLRDEVNNESGVYVDRNITNDYTIEGIENYNTNYILTCYDDIDYNRSYHVFIRSEYVEDTLRSIATQLDDYLDLRILINSEDYFERSNGDLVVGFGMYYSQNYNSTNENRLSLYVRCQTNGSSNIYNLICYEYFDYFDSDHIYNHRFVTTSANLEEFNKLFNGNRRYIKLNDYTGNIDLYKLCIFYFSEYSVRDIGLYFNYGNLLGKFSYFFPVGCYEIADNVIGVNGSGLTEFQYGFIPGVFHRGANSYKWNYIYIEFRRVTTHYVYSLTPMSNGQTILYSPVNNSYDYVYIPVEIGLCDDTSHTLSGGLLNGAHQSICTLAHYVSSINGYRLGIQNDDRPQSIIINSISGEYLESNLWELNVFFTPFYALSKQCAFVNGFYFYIDPNGNVHTGLTNVAVGGDIAVSYIGDVFYIINMALTSFTGLFGYYILPGISIGLLIALPLIATLLLFIIKLFKR